MYKTQKERELALKESQRIYNATHKEKIRARNKKWREAHPDYNRQWREAHPDYNRVYFQRNKERIYESTKERYRIKSLRKAYGLDE